jgi:hypothetical protein
MCNDLDTKEKVAEFNSSSPECGVIHCTLNKYSVSRIVLGYLNKVIKITSIAIVARTWAVDFADIFE